MAEMLGAGLIRVTVNSEEDIQWVRGAADPAGERGIAVVQETHTDSPFETVSECLHMIRKINRKNFGILLDPANLVLCGQDYGAESLKPLAPSIFNVYVQNVRTDQQGDLSVTTRSGEVRYRRLVVGESGGVEIRRLVEGLQEINYSGFLTSHQPLVKQWDVRNLSQRVFSALSRYDSGG